MIDHIHFGKTRIEFFVIRSPARKHLGITIRDQAVTILAPPSLANPQIKELVRRKAAWIIAKLDLNRQIPPHYPREITSGETLKYLGRQYLLRVQNGSPSVKLSAGSFLLTLEKQEQGHQLLQSWYQNHLSVHLRPIIKKYAGILGIPSPPLHIRDLGKRWGSCGKKGTLYFHWQLATLPSRSISFIAAHEITHLREPNHSAAFRRLLTSLLPEEANKAGLLYF